MKDAAMAMTMRSSRIAIPHRSSLQPPLLSWDLDLLRISEATVAVIANGRGIRHQPPMQYQKKENPTFFPATTPKPIMLPDSAQLN